MLTLTVPLSGRLLLSHLAAYGLGLAIEADGGEALVGHDPTSLELDPQVTTVDDLDAVARSIRQSAARAETAVEADLVPGLTGNERRPVVWARATRVDRARAALAKRETLLDELERRDERLVVAAVAGLGVPAAWLPKPQWGASQFDGVIGNNTSDIVRGVLRRARPQALGTAGAHLASSWLGNSSSGPSSTQDRDRSGWAPSGTSAPLLAQWLAVLGLGLVPVGVRAGEPSRTPCFRREGRERFAVLPVLASPVSVCRLRALLQLPELTGTLPAADRARLRSLGVDELVSFAVEDRSNANSIAFTFRRGERIEL